MMRWWKKRSVRLRLTVWYASITAAVLAAFAAFFYHHLQERLASEIDRQLRIDFDLIEAQVEPDASGKMRWLLRGSHGDEGYARLSAWFEVWSEDGELLLRHWPVSEAQIRRSLAAPTATSLQFWTAELDPGLFVRIMERPARIFTRGVVLRIFRDETEMRRTLRDTLEVFALGLPLAVLLSSVAGYFIASRFLAPVAEMAGRARRISSERMSDRLPVRNEHDELGQLALVFNEMLTRLQKSFQNLRQFSADASHELRSPLTAIRTVGEIGLRESRSSEELRETIESMLEEGQQMADLVDTMLSLARMENTSPIVTGGEPVQLSSLFGDVQSLLEILAQEKQQTLNVLCEPGLTFSGDPFLLRQALVNVVHNAIRYSPEGTGIDVRARAGKGSVCIEVADQGPGIAQEHRAAIFERFYRVDKSRSRDQGAFGLGLAIAQRCMELQRGRIEVESELGKGTVFRLVLPVS